MKHFKNISISYFVKYSSAYSPFSHVNLIKSDVNNQLTDEQRICFIKIKNYEPNINACYQEYSKSHIRHINK
jgi:hypothetical protein